MKKYIGLGNIDKEKDERPAWPYFAVIDEDGTEYGFYTDRSLNGRFRWDEDSREYKQTKGTLDFDMCCSASTARKRIAAYMEEKKMINEWRQNPEEGNG